MKTAALFVLLFAIATYAAERKPQALKSPKPDPSFEYWESVKTAQHRYLARLPEQLAAADELEVFLLAPKESKPGQEIFSSDVGGQDTYVVESRTLDGVAMRSWMQAIQGTLRGAKDNAVGCHNPIHGIKLWMRNIVDGRIQSKELIFASTLCWQCGNFGVRLPDRCSIFAFPERDRALEDLCIKLFLPTKTPKTDAPK